MLVYNGLRPRTFGRFVLRESGRAISFNLSNAELPKEPPKVAEITILSDWLMGKINCSQETECSRIVAAIAVNLVKIVSSADQTLVYVNPDDIDGLHTNPSFPTSVCITL